MKDSTGREIQVGDTIAFARRTGSYSKRHVIVKGTVTAVAPDRISYTFESKYYGTQKAWTKSPQKTLVI